MDSTNNCTTCGNKITVTCDWRQGRCPHRPPMFTNYHFRFYNLINFIKNLFK